MYSEDIKDKDTERLKRSIRASVIIHIVLIIVLSILIARKEKETSPKLLEVCRISESEAKEIRKTLEEKKAAEKKMEAEREIKKESTEMEMKSDDMGNKGDLGRKLSGADAEGVEKSVHESSAKPYVPPSVGPQVGEKEKKGIIEAKGEVSDNVNEADAQDDKTGDIKPKAFLDRLRSSLIRRREKKRQEKEEKTNDIVRSSAEKSKSLIGKETDARISIQNDVSHDKAKFLSYAKTYSMFGEEKDFNRIIDFSFSSGWVRRSFFRKYDIRIVPAPQASDITIERNEEQNRTTITIETQRNSKSHKLVLYYRKKYGAEHEPSGYVGEEYIYMFPQSVHDIMIEKYYEKMSLKYGITDRKQIDELIKPIPKLVIVYEIDEKKLEFRIRELEVFDID